MRFALLVNCLELAVIGGEAQRVCEPRRVGVQYAQIIVWCRHFVVLVYDDLHAIYHLAVGITNVCCIEVKLGYTVHCGIAIDTLPFGIFVGIRLSLHPLSGARRYGHPNFTDVLSDYRR